MEDDSDDNIEGGHSFLILSRSDSSMVLISSYILYLMLIQLFFAKYKCTVCITGKEFYSLCPSDCLI